MRTALLTVYLALFLILIGTCYRKSWKAWHVPAKCANSAGFIALLLAGLALRGNSAFIYSLLPPFLFCFLGDFFLALCQGKDSRVLLMGGLASFLMAHILFIVCFLNLSAFHWTDQNVYKRQEFMERIYKPFEQESLDVARNQTGSGLGLSIVCLLYTSRCV